MLSPGDQIETLDFNKLNTKFRKLDSDIQSLKNFGPLDEDFKLQASLLGSGYIIDVAGQENKHVEYEDKDIDLFVPDRDAVEMLEDNMASFYSDSVDGQFYANVNRDWSAPIEIHTEIVYDLGSEDEKLRVESELEEDIEDPFATPYDGDNLEVTLPHPETYADTKNASNEEDAQIYRDQIRTLEYILEDEISAETNRNQGERAI